MRLACLALLIAAPHAGAGRIHVSALQTQGANDGSSWADAHRGPHALQAALLRAQAGDEIWVAQGVYLPSSTGDASQSFVLKAGVAILGGFAGGETHSSQAQPRILAAILSGDLAQDDALGQFADNSSHVLKSGTADAATRLDGLVITGGWLAGYLGSNADPSMLRCTFRANHGPAVQLVQNARGAFDSCRFERNTAPQGSAIDLLAAGPSEFINCVVAQNTVTTLAGGTILCGNASARFLHLTLADNLAPPGGSAGLHGNAATAVENSILWNNTGGDGNAGDVRSSCLETAPLGPHCLRAQPLFLDSVRGDYRLSPVSPCVDRGNGNASGLPVLDQEGLPRVVDQPGMPDLGVGLVRHVDLGAHEAPLSSHTPLCWGDGTQFTPCPCASGALGRGCANSLPGSLGALLNATGDTQPDTLGLQVTGVPEGALCVFLSGSNGGIGMPFGDGVLCSEGIVRRLFVRQAVEGNARVPDLHAGEPKLGERSAELGDPIPPGQIRYYQVWYRDGVATHCPQGGLFNVSSGVIVHW